jgi:hypothetical protein
MIPNVTPDSSTIISSWPAGSNRRARGARDSGTNRPVSTTTATTTGTFSQKIDRQPTASTNAPPSSGPRAMDRPITPPHTPIAFARSARSVKTFVMIDMATGLSIEPPTACRARNVMSHPVVGARLHSSDPAPNRTRPVWNVRRLPIRSPVEPPSMSRLASTSV